MSTDPILEVAQHMRANVPGITDEQARLAATVALTLFAEREPAPSAQGPAELWLQLHGDCSEAELSEPVDYTGDAVTWCWHQINDSDVRYVRADLAGVRATRDAPVRLTDEEIVKGYERWQASGSVRSPFIAGAQFARARLAPAVQEPANPWKEAVLDALANACMDAPLDEPPHSILKRVIAIEVQIALDPAVSSEAQALIDRGAAGVPPTSGGEQFARVADAITDTPEEADALQAEYERRRNAGVKEVDRG